MPPPMGGPPVGCGAEADSDDDFATPEPRSWGAAKHAGAKRAAPAPARAPGACKAARGDDAADGVENEGARARGAAPESPLPGRCGAALPPACARAPSPRRPLALLSAAEVQPLAPVAAAPRASLGASNDAAAAAAAASSLSDEDDCFAALPQFTQLVRAVTAQRAAPAAAAAEPAWCDADAAAAFDDAPPPQPQPAAASPAPANAWAAARAAARAAAAAAAAEARRRDSFAHPDSPAASSSRIASWLASLQLSRFLPLFRAAEGLTYRALITAVGEDDLTAMGVLQLGPRLRMLSSLAAMRAGVALPDAGASSSERSRAVPARRAAAATGPERSIAQFFGGGGGGGRAAAAARPAKAKKQQQARVARPQRQPRSREPPPGEPPPAIPPWQAVAGTPFLVDAFGASARHVSSATWILTHFHSDHYQSLSATWARGPILCTPVTAALVAARLRVAPRWLRPLPLRCRTLVDGCHVTFLEANHCPGAAMVLLEPPPPHPPVLHTGDCRWDSALMEPELGPYLERLRDREQLRLILDTTYGCPLTRAAFPPAADAAAFVAAAVAAEAFNPRTLFLFGTYTIGKERVFLAAARAARRAVYCGAAKRAVLTCLNLPPEEMALITDDERATNLHVVPMSAVSFSRMKGVLAHYKGRFNTVVGFAPTGWAYARSAAGARKVGGKRVARGSLVRYDVPYSEHSSFAELRAAVRYLRPAAICPSVDNDQGPRAAAVVAALLAPEDAPPGPLQQPWAG